MRLERSGHPALILNHRLVALVVSVLTVVALLVRVPADWSAVYGAEFDPSSVKIERISQTSGRGGDPVTVCGSGWEAGTTVTLRWDQPAVDLGTATPKTDNTPRVPDDSCTSSEPSPDNRTRIGTFLTTVTIPADAGSGRHTLTVTQTTTANKGTIPTSGTFTRTITFDVTVDKPAITLNPTTGTEGAQVTVTGINWEPNRTVSLFWDQPSTTLPTTTAQANGTLPAGVIFNVPTGSEPGAHTVLARQTTANGTVLQATATFTVTEGAPTIASFTPTSGPTGTVVTITGTNFRTTTGVTFNNVAATFTVQSATSIVATVPSGATAGRIRVTNPAGTATSTTDFGVQPRITSFSPTSAPVGAQVTITGTGFSDNTIVSFFNNVTAPTTVDSATSIRAIVPPGATSGPITATNPAGSGASPTSFVVIAKYVVTASTTRPIPGSTVTLSAQLAEANNTPIKTAGITVNWSLAVAGGSLSSATSTTNSNGIATVVLTTTADAGRSYDITASSTIAGQQVSGTSPTITAVDLGIAAVGATTRSGTVTATLTADPLVVKVTDSTGAATVNHRVEFAFGSVPPGATGHDLDPATTALDTSITVLTDGNGEARATLKLGTKAGDYTVQARGNKPDGTALNGSPVTFTATAQAGAASQIVFVTPPGGGIATQALSPQPVVEVRDNQGNPVKTDPTATTDDNVTISFTPNTNEEGATLGGTTSVAVNWTTGRATFTNLSINLRGSYQLRATLTVGASTFTVDSTALSVSQGAADRLATVTGGGQSALVGATLGSPFVVKVTDAGGNPISGFTVNWSVTGPANATGQDLDQATADAQTNFTTTTDANGEAKATLTLGNRAGTYTVQATAAVPNGSPQTFTATAVPKLEVFTGNNQRVAVNGTATLVARAVNAAGGPVAGVQVAFGFATGSVGGGNLAQGTVTTGTDGTASVVLTAGATRGTYRVDASISTTDFPTLPQGAVRSVTFTTEALPSLTLNPVQGPAGTAVTVSGAGWNANTTVTLAWDQPATPSAATATTNNNGAFANATFNVPKGSELGLHTVTATQGSNVAARATFTVERAPATKFLVGVAATRPVAGSAVRLRAQLADVDGNPVPTGNVQVTWTLTQEAGAGGSLSAGTSNTDANGVAIIALTTGPTAGRSYTVKASEGTKEGTSPAIVTVAGAPATVTPVGTTTRAGVIKTSVSALKLKVADQNTNAVANVRVDFAITGTPSGATGQTLDGGQTTIAVLTNSSGEAEATLTLGTKTGDYTVIASHDINGDGDTLDAGERVTFTATATHGTATKLAFVPQPGGGVAANAWSQQPVVAVQDSEGNTATTNQTAVVTLAITANTGAAGAQLTCFQTQNNVTSTTAANGLASFGGCQINTGSTTSYTLTATATGLTAATSFSFNITTGPASRLAFISGSGQKGVVTSTLASPFVVKVTDTGGNPVSGFTVTWTVSSSPSGATGQTLAPDLDANTAGAQTVTDGNGEARATLTLGNRAGTYTVRANAAVPTDPVQTFTATAVPVLVTVSGDNQEGPAGGDLGQTLTVKTQTTAGAAVPGVRVSFDFGTVPTGATGQRLNNATAPLEVTTGADGTAQVQVKLGDKVGSYTITASLLTADFADPLPSGAVRSVSFRARVATPKIFLSTSSGPRGAAVQVSGTGFAVGQTVTIEFDTTGTLAAVTTTPAAVTADAAGTFSNVRFTIPSDATLGGHTVRARQATSVLSATAALTIFDTLLTLTPATGGPGSSVRIVGTGFVGNQPVTLRWDKDVPATGANVVNLTAAPVTADANGFFAVAVSLPSSADAGADGVHAVTAVQGEVVKSTSFTLTRNRAIVLTLSTGPAGTNLNASIVGFSPNATVNFSFDGAAFALPVSVVTNANGDSAVPVALAVPTTALTGSHTITATGPFGSASATFVVTVPPTIQLNPVAGPVGTQVKVQGAGFAAGQAVTITWDDAGSTVLANVLAANVSATGTFSADITIPAAAGRHTITGTQGGAQATATFVVVTPVTLRGKVVFDDATPDNPGDNLPFKGAQGWVNQPLAPGGERGFQVSWTANNNGEFEVSVLPGTYNVGVFGRVNVQQTILGNTILTGQTVRVLSPESGVSINQAGQQTPAVLLGGQARTILLVAIPEVTISGAVVRSDGSGVVGAAVTLTEVDDQGRFLAVGGQTRSGDGGAFTFQVGTGKRWKVGAFVPGAGPITPVAVNPNTQGLPDLLSSNIMVDLSLPGTATLTGGVQVNGAGIPGVAINATGGSSTVTDTGGAYTLSLPRPLPGETKQYPVAAWSPQTGQVSVTLTVNGFGVITCPATPVANTSCDTANKDITTAGLNFTFSTDNLTIRLVDSTGNLVNAAMLREVSAQATSPGAPGNTATAKGSNTLSLSLLTGATYALGVNVTGFGSFSEKDITVPSTVDITLPTVVTISGRVADANGNGLEGAVVSVTGITNKAFGASTTTCSTLSSAVCSENGNYSIRVPANASYTVSAAKAGFPPGAPLDRPVTTTDLTAVDFVLQPFDQTKRVRGNATGGNLLPDADVTITAVRQGDNRTAVTSRGLSRDDCPVDSRGQGQGGKTQYCMNLEPGIWLLTARANGYQTTSPLTVTIEQADLTNKQPFEGQHLTLSAIPDFQDRPPQTQQVTTNEGATVVDAVNKAGVQVPPGAMGSSAESASITTQQTTDIAVPGGVGIMGSRAIQVDIRDEQGRRITNFAQPLTITIDYSDLGLSTQQIADLRCSRFDTTANAWVTIPFTNDTVNRVLTCYTDRLTKFAGIAPPVVGEEPTRRGGGGGPSGEVVVTPPANQVDTSTGGPVTQENVTVNVPAGVTATPTSLTVQVTVATVAEEAQAALPEGALPGSRVFDLTLKDASGAAVTEFAQALEIAVPYSAEDLRLAGGDPSRLQVYRYDAATKTWQALETIVDTNTRTLKAKTSKTSLFAIMVAVPAPTDLKSPTVVFGLETTLAWTNPPNTTQFQVQVIPFNLDGPAINMIIGRADLVQLARFQVPAPVFGQGNYIMLPGMTYTWRVRTSPVTTALTETAPGWSTYVEGTFRTSIPTSATISPVSTATGGNIGSLTPTLRWSNANTSIFYYEVQLSQDQTFTVDPAAATAAVYWNLVHGGESDPPNSWTVPQGFDLEAGTTYYWRVRPRVQGDGTPVDWSQTWSFRTP
ncbi:MAG: carboxypeptidase regulatory-like domain-containing protein [Chloroflexi bacterium]|nr:carboxypeptidase regulatory-like domain-containing protein [Chloroflexota bacterium]